MKCHNFVRNMLIVTALSMAAVVTMAYPKKPQSASRRKPAVKVSNVNIRNGSLVKSLKDVDFANMEYAGFRLTKGNYEHKEDFSFESAKLEHVWLFDVQSGQPHHSLVFLDYSEGSGSSNDEGLLFVFEVQDRHATAIQQLAYDRQAEGEGVTFDPASSRLTVKARSNDDSPHCCAKSLDVVTFAWTPKGFSQTGVRVIPIHRTGK